MMSSALQARMEGNIRVFFYDTEAGVTEVKAKYARPRAIGNTPYTMEVGPSALAPCNAL